MASVIVVLPKIEDARKMKGLLQKNGIQVAGVCATGAQAIAKADGLEAGVVLCGYRLADMIYSQVQECLPGGFEMLLIASADIISGGVERGVMCLSMPVKLHDLLGTLDMMLQNIEGRRRKRRAKPKERNAKEAKLIQDAKGVLMSRNHMTEEEAHRYLQKCSMDSGTNMAETAQMALAMMKG